MAAVLLAGQINDGAFISVLLSVITMAVVIIGFFAQATYKDFKTLVKAFTDVQIDQAAMKEKLKYHGEEITDIQETIRNIKHPQHA